METSIAGISITARKDTGMPSVTQASFTSRNTASRMRTRRSPKYAFLRSNWIRSRKTSDVSFQTAISIPSGMTEPRSFT